MLSYKDRSMFFLPDVLIDMIYSYDDNKYHKNNYKLVINELKHLYYRRLIHAFLAGLHHYHRICCDCWMDKYSRDIKITEYIFMHVKQYGNMKESPIILSNMRVVLNRFV